MSAEPKKLTMIRQRPSTPRAVGARTPATHLPIAQVLVDTSVQHLDRAFDYLVSIELDQEAKPGVRVKVRFAGRLVEGWLVERKESSEHEGMLSFLTSVVSPEPVLSTEILQLCQKVANRWAGSTSDVLRSAIPPRQARVEREETAEDFPPRWREGVTSLFDLYPRCASFSEAVASGSPARAIWQALPSRDPFADLTDLLSKISAETPDAGMLVILPDAGDVARLESHLRERLMDASALVVLTADLGPAERYRRFLRLSRGSAHICIGTRAAAFAPIHRLRLVVIWDDGDQSHYEQHAPGWNARDVLALRSHLQGVAFLSGSFSISTEAAGLLSSGWASVIEPERSQIRSHAPSIGAGADRAMDPARVSSRSWQVIRDGLKEGPVLIQTARRGYRPAMQCQSCRSPARCECGGRIGQADAQSHPACVVCGSLATGWTCEECNGRRLRSSVVGVDRTAEELGRAFPGVTIRISNSQTPLRTVPNKPAIVIATPGLEPFSPSGYAAAVVLDALSSLLRVDLRAEEETRRRWFNALSLLRSGARAIIEAPPEHPSVQALIRWDPQGAASRELNDRQRSSMPPAMRLAVVDGSPLDIHSAAEFLGAIEGFEVLGPIDHDENQERLVVRSKDAQLLAARLKELVVMRSAKKEAPLRIRVDPYSV
jgi:primosomal protein N' (replication factor Y) (superfamily II helicase)